MLKKSWQRSENSVQRYSIEKLAFGVDRRNNLTTCAGQGDPEQCVCSYVPSLISRGVLMENRNELASGLAGWISVGKPRIVTREHFHFLLLGAGRRPSDGVSFFTRPKHGDNMLQQSTVPQFVHIPLLANGNSRYKPWPCLHPSWLRLETVFISTVYKVV